MGGVGGWGELYDIQVCFGFFESIHVNPPSFVRSLRHFGIVEILRPGDENLRHLTVTSIFKKIAYFLAITNVNAKVRFFQSTFPCKSYMLVSQSDRIL